MMLNSKIALWETPTTQQFAEVLCAIADQADMQNFLRDIMTEKELIEISARLEAARLLSRGERYLTITQQTKLSSRTVARISDWLKNGCNGYRIALQIIKSHHDHIPPARAV